MNQHNWVISTSDDQRHCSMHLVGLEFLPATVGSARCEPWGWANEYFESQMTHPGACIFIEASHRCSGLSVHAQNPLFWEAALFILSKRCT